MFAGIVPSSSPSPSSSVRPNRMGLLGSGFQCEFCGASFDDMVDVNHYKHCDDAQRAAATVEEAQP